MDEAKQDNSPTPKRKKTLSSLSQEKDSNCKQGSGQSSFTSFIEPDRLQVGHSNSQRRESFLYKSDSDGDSLSLPRSTSRHSSISSEGPRDELVTPFAQILSSLHSIRSNFIMLTNIRHSRYRRGSDGFHLNSRVGQLYETGDGKLIRDDMFKKITMETLKEFDWCLEQLESLKTSMSVSEMASHKFKRLLDRELKDFSDAGFGGSEISAWVYSTFVDKQLDTDSSPERTEPLVAARSRNLVKPIKKLTRSLSCSGSVARFGVECADENHLEELMEDLDKWTFDVFRLDELTASRPLVAISYTILQTRDLLKSFKIRPSTFINYMSTIEAHYLRDVPFHNSLHAADVAHATHVLLSASAFEGVFSELEMFSAILASAVHDVDHPGVNNQFLVNSNSEMALMYNDESVLENHHLAVAFQLMQQEHCDIFEHVDLKERRMMRKMVIEMVLATDNAKHLSLLGALKTIMETKQLSNSRPLLLDSSDRQHILKCLVHCADLSNPTRPLAMYQRWVDRLMREFFRQGDIERQNGMEISPMMDRHNADVEKTQVVFVDFVVHPLWETWADLVYPDAQPILEALEQNRDWYKSQCRVSPLTTPPDTPRCSTPTSLPQQPLGDRRGSWQPCNGLFGPHRECSALHLPLKQQDQQQRQQPSWNELRRKSDSDYISANRSHNLQEVRRRLMKYVPVSSSQDCIEAVLSELSKEEATADQRVSGLRKHFSASAKGAGIGQLAKEGVVGKTQLTSTEKS